MASHASQSFSGASFHGITGAAAKWALPRLGVYFAAAFTGAVLFMGWAIVYTYVWPAPEKTSSQILPPINILPSPKPVLQTPPAYKGQERISPGSSPLVAQGSIYTQTLAINRAARSFEARFIGAPVFGLQNQRIGTVNDVLFGANGTPKAILIGLQCASCEAKRVAIPFSGVKWLYDKAPSNGPYASMQQPDEIPRALIGLSASELQQAPAFLE